MINDKIQKNNWQIKKLGDIESIIFMRGNGLKKSLIKKDGKFYCILYGELYTKYKYPAIKNVITRTNFDGKIKSINGDVLVPGTTTADAYGIAIARSINKKDVVLGGDINILRTQNKEIISDYLSYFLNGPAKSELASYANGTNIMHLSNKNIQKIEISYPPLREQARIVKIFDEVFDKIEIAKKNAEKNLQNSKELFKSYLQNILEKSGANLEKKTLESITSILGDGLHGTPRYTSDGEYYFINGNNLNSGKIIFKERTKKVSFSEYEKYKKKLNKRTILVSINGTLGNVALYNDEKIILGKSACYFNLIESVDKNFIKYVILSPQFLEYINTVATGATIKNVSLKSMREYEINLPALVQQKQIVNKLDNLSEQTKKLEKIYQQKINNLDELKKSILQKAFEGEL